MKRPHRIVLAAAVFLVAGSVLYWKPVFRNNKDEGRTLRLSGNIEAHESLVSFKVSGRVIDLPIEEGQWVEKGQVLARLEDNDYQQQAHLDQAALQVSGAQLQLDLAGTRRQEIAADEQSVREALADLAQKQLDYRRAEALYEQQVGSQQARDQALTNLKQAEATAKRAQEVYDQAQEGTRREQIVISRASVEQAREKLRVSRLNLEHTILRAPADGVISVRQAELGEVVAPGSPIVTLADLDHVWLRAYVSETDLARIRWGQHAAVTSDSYPGKTYRGRISFISPEAEFTPKSVQTFKERVTLVYRIKIDLDNVRHELKPGMPADAALQLEP